MASIRTTTKIKASMARSRDRSFRTGYSVERHFSAAPSSRSVENVDRVVWVASEAPHHVRSVEVVSGAARSCSEVRRAAKGSGH